ncbi:hypothetical protein K9L27_02550 [Candidatus Gracilibacteria bacterium]|nr:hypothetical protein [Candidatus Gracilibacteria bacterium]
MKTEKMLSENIESSFGFTIEKENIRSTPWDQEIVRRSQSLWGRRSVETSLKFVQAHE